jgi:hypothetical protein
MMNRGKALKKNVAGLGGPGHGKEKWIRTFKGGMGGNLKRFVFSFSIDAEVVPNSPYIKYLLISNSYKYFPARPDNLLNFPVTFL